MIKAMKRGPISCDLSTMSIPVWLEGSRRLDIIGKVCRVRLRKVLNDGRGFWKAVSSFEWENDKIQCAILEVSIRFLGMSWESRKNEGR